MKITKVKMPNGIACHLDRQEKGVIVLSVLRKNKLLSQYVTDEGHVRNLIEEIRSGATHYKGCS